MKRILVGIDFTEADNTVIDVVKPLAKALGANLTLIHSTPPLSQWVGCYLAYVHEDIMERKEEAKVYQEKLDALVAALAKEGIAADTALIEGHSGPGIVKYAQEKGYDQIAIGTHSKNMVERALLGSSADHVVRKSSVPVMVVPTIK
jgi:nucleotide-binding universal stress UspA family protein